MAFIHFFDDLGIELALEGISNTVTKSGLKKKKF